MLTQFCILFIGTFLIFMLMRRPNPSNPPIKWPQTEFIWNANLSYDYIEHITPHFDNVEHKTPHFDNVTLKYLKNTTWYKWIPINAKKHLLSKKIVSRYKSNSIQRMVVFSDAYVDTTGFIFQTGSYRTFRNGGCDALKERKYIKMWTSVPTYDFVVTLAAPWTNNLWHFVAEALGVLGFVPGQHNYKIHIKKISKMTLEWLEIAGIDKSRVISGTIFAKKLIVMEIGKCGNPKSHQLQWLRNKIKANSPSRKTVLLIKRTKRRPSSDFELVKQIVQTWSYQQNLQFVVFSDKNLPSIEEQLDMFRNVHTIVAPHGAGLINMLASPPGTNIVEFVNVDHPNMNFMKITFDLGFEYFSVPQNYNEKHKIIPLETKLKRLKDVLDQISANLL